MFKSKVVKAVSTGILGATVLGVVWTGGDTIQKGIDFITGADAKIKQAVSNIDLLKSGVISKNNQIKVLNAEIESLQEQLENSTNASQEEIRNLQEQLNSKVEELKTLTQEVASLNADIERLTQENTSIKNELNKANEDVELLKVALSESTLNSVELDSTEEIQAIINGTSGESGETSNINWIATGNGTTKPIADLFIKDTKEVLNNYIKGLGISTEGLEITVEGAYEMSGTNCVKIYTRGATEGAKAELTKDKLNDVLRTNFGTQFSIESVLHR